MTATVAKISVEALSLPRKSRAELAERLLVSLEDEASSPEIEAAWKSATKKRYKKYLAGKASVRSAKDVMRDAYRSLK